MPAAYAPIDFHAHCLPELDHGCPSLRLGIAQRRLMQEAGLLATVATPHFYAHTEASVDAFLERRNAAARALLTAAPEGPALYLGAEVLVMPGLEEMAGLDRLCIEGTNVLLLEFPFGGWPERCVRTVEAIAERGITPLLAHIDRYPIKDLDALFEGNRYLYQVNASALLGWSRRAAYFRRMVAEGAVAAIGSDIHGNRPDSYRALLRVARKVHGFASVCEHSREILAAAIPATV